MDYFYFRCFESFLSSTGADIFFCQSMLEDPSHIVRSLLAFGLCKICAVYWEFIPADVVKALLTSLVQKHAWDSSNTEVRLAIVKVGLIFFFFVIEIR